MSETDTLDSMLRGVAAAPSVRPPPKIGDRLGDRYVIEAFVGEGGMGTVFRAHDEKLGEAVALKIVHGAFGDVLRDEVRLAQKVTHPNVCRTFDLEELDGHHIVKMEYVAGETLAARLHRDTKLDIAEVIRIARAIGDGLAAAHAKQIVHGDLKPANVMLDDQRVVLMDFGIARLVAAPTDGLRGTLGYMAPEQVRNQDIDVRADLYALGCVTYEMLAGEPVFGTDTPIAIAARHVSDPAPDVRGKRPETPRWLARAVAKLLAKAPSDRTAGVGLLRSGPRSRARVIVPVVVVVAAIAAGVAWRATRKAPWVADVVDFRAYDENNNNGLSFSPDGAWIAFMSDRGDHEQTLPYLMSRDPNGETIPLSIPIPPDSFITDIVWSRHGTALLVQIASGKNGIHTFRQPMTGTPPRPTGTAVDLGPTAGSVEECGDDLAYTKISMSGWPLFLRTRTGETRLLLTTDVGQFIAGPHCDATGNRIAIVIKTSWIGADGDVFLVDRDGKRTQLTTDHQAGDAIFTPDGRALVVSQDVQGTGKSQLYELPLDGGPARRLVFDTGNDVLSAVSRDGRYLTFERDDSSYDPTISSSSPTPRFITHESGAFWYPLSVTDNVIVTQHSYGPNWDIATVRLDNGAVTVLARGSNPFPSFDHTRIYYVGEDRHQLFVVPLGGGTSERVAVLPGKIQYLNEGPDGIHLLVETAVGELTGFRLAAGVATSEGVHGLVSVAHDGGWRAVTMIAGNQLNHPVDLLLVPPGEPLDHPRHTLRAISVHNRWLDDHRISYCAGENNGCFMFDVTTAKATPLAPESRVGGMMCSATLDGTHVLGLEMVGKVTRHIVTNFDKR